MTITPAEITAFVWLAGALVMSFLLTAYFAKHPYEPELNEVGWKGATTLWSFAWPVVVLAVFAYYVIRPSWAALRRHTGRLHNPWAALYEKLQGS